MQKLFAVVLLWLVMGSVYAEEIKIVDGEIMLAPCSLVATGVKISPEAQRHPREVTEAFRNKGKIVPVVTKVEEHIVDLFHIEAQTVLTIGVKYDQASNMIVVMKESKAVVEPKIQFLWFPVWWLAGMLAMIMSSMLVRREKYKPAFLFAFVAALFVIISIPVFPVHDDVGLTLVVAFVSHIVSLIASIVVFVATVDRTTYSTKEFIRANVVYYLAMITTVTIVYYPLF